MGRYLFFFFLLMASNLPRAAAQLDLKRKADTTAQPISLRVLPQNFYNHQLGYFCKKEIQLQKLTAINLFIRLGSKEYVDYMERKPNAVKRQ